jgi:hypothetical protein
VNTSSSHCNDVNQQPGGTALMSAVTKPGGDS